MEITYDDFKKVQIKVGTVLEVKKNEKARKPSLVVKVDFGKDVGIKQSSAQITHFYNSENLVGKTVKASYTKSIEREVVEYRPAILPESVAERGMVLDEKIIVYTIKGTQELVSETPEGWIINFRTKSGAEMIFLADEEVFNGHVPSKFDGVEVKLSFIEYENFNLKNLEIIK
jgi:hypothetical protein